MEASLTAEFRPTVWSPGDQSWVSRPSALASSHRSAAEFPKPVHQPCGIQIGFAMWRPMAEAMGWPEQAIGWREVPTFWQPTQGWAAYGHPEWGQFKFGIPFLTTRTLAY